MSGRSASLRSEQLRSEQLGRLPLEVDGEGRWLEYLSGVYSQKPRYFGRWRRTSTDLARTLEAIQDSATALSTTPAGPEAVARSIAGVASRHFGGARCVLSIESKRLVHGGGSREELSIAVTSGGQAPAGVGRRVGTPQSLPSEKMEVEDIALTLDGAIARAMAPIVMVRAPDGTMDIVNPLTACTPGELLPCAVALGAPITIDERGVGSLVVVGTEAMLIDQNDVSVLSILANQAAAAVDAAIRLEERVLLHERALEGWREAARVARALEARQRELEQAQRALDAATKQRLIDQERHRIAADLHDSVVQHLVSIGMSLEWCRRASDEPLIAEHLASTQELARVTLARLRRTIFELASVAGEHVEVIPAMEEFVKELRGRADVRLSVRGVLGRLEAPVAHAIFHCAQEATYNALHHGKAGRVWISLSVGRRDMTLSVTDDGCGDPAILAELVQRSGETNARTLYHTGLRELRRRVEALDGAVSVSGRRGGGIRLTLRIPHRQPAITG